MTIHWNKSLIALLMALSMTIKSNAQTSINPELEDIKYLIEFGGYYGVDAFNSHGTKDVFTTFKGLQGQLKFKKIMLSADAQYLERIVDDKQLVLPFFNNTYKLCIGGKAAVAIGYCDNKWVSSFATSATSSDSRTVLKNAAGQTVSNVNEISNGLYKFSAPSMLLGYQFTVGRELKPESQGLLMDEYDVQHQSKLRNMYVISGSIDLMYSPSVKQDTTILYSPYGYYVPTPLYVSGPVKKRAFGAQIKMMVTTPYVVGLHLTIGMLPGVYSQDIDNKMGICARAGVMVNFSKGKTD